MTLLCPRCGGSSFIGGVCRQCDGGIQSSPYDASQALAEAMAARLAMLQAGISTGGRRADAQMFGGKGIIKFNPSTAETGVGIKQQVTLFAWQSKSGYPETVTIEVGRIAGAGVATFPSGQDQATPPNSLSYRARAMVLMGTPGAMQDPFFIDVGRGQRFTACVSYLALTVEMLTPPPGYVSGSLATYGNLGDSPGGAATTASPTLLTLHADNLGQNQSTGSAGQPADLVIPPRAAFVQPVRSNDVNNLFTLTWLDNKGATIDLLQMSNGQMVLPAPIPDSAYSIRITNQGVNGATSYHPEFQISV